jgi:anti-anti-sigma factor
MSEIAPHDAATPVGLVIQRSIDAGGIVLELAGELDLESAPEFERHVQELQPSNPGRLLIDLSGLKFMDSTGLAVMVRAGRSARDNDYRLLLRPGPPQVQRLFELTGVLEHFAFEE